MARNTATSYTIRSLIYIIHTFDGEVVMFEWQLAVAVVVAVGSSSGSSSSSSGSSSGSR
jgi:hypothetical protein